MWGGRTENIPESQRKTPASSPSTSWTAKRQQRGGRGRWGEGGVLQSGEPTGGGGADDDASTLLGIFFQLKSWELESVNNDLGLQTTL